ncbi:hypothetical protein Golob_022675 [Gossypium lobatum]|uniref:Protein SKIP34 n=11 Tax=Gossypium TaxID=3633 RepID=A0A7J8LHR9_9ROSI|nr:hypothetical protein [Gossypium lobatum]
MSTSIIDPKRALTKPLSLAITLQPKLSFPSFFHPSKRQTFQSPQTKKKFSEEKMCYGHHRRSLSPDRPPRNNNNNALVVDTLRVRLAETEARLERARAREAELTRRLEEMKRFVSVMEILESYLKQRFREQQEYVARFFSSLPAK